jgi:NitT/TauT family transport system substrate-binding protein
MIKLKSFRAALLALGTLASSVAMGQTVPAAGNVTVRIQKYPGVVSLLAIVAAEKGYCTKYGITCVLSTLPSSVVGLQAMLSGSLEVATPAVEPALQLAAKGTPVRLIGNISRNGPYVFAVSDQVSALGQPKGFPALMQELKGKKVGVTTRGSGPEYILKSMLKASDMKEDDVTIVAVGGPDTAYAALINKQVDAVTSFEPMGAFCEVLKTCRVGVWLSRGQGPKELTLLAGAYVPMVVRAEYAQKNPKVIAALRSAFKDAETFIQTSSNLDDVLSITKKHFKMEHPQADALIATMVRNTIPSLYSEIDPKGVQAAADYMFRTGQLDKPIDVSELVLR